MIDLLEDFLDLSCWHHMTTWGPSCSTEVDRHSPENSVLPERTNILMWVKNKVQINTSGFLWRIFSGSALDTLKTNG